jgi:hypothetical protein
VHMKKIVIFITTLLVAFGMLVCDTTIPDMTEAVKEFEKKVALNPIQLAGNPYTSESIEPPLDQPDAVCAIQYEEDRIHYTLGTFENEETAESNDFIVTHKTPCGTCSTLKDLAVYLKYEDLTTPVRKCSSKVASKALAMDCLTRLGFTHDCAETWYYNALNTAQECFAVCIISWLKNEPFNNEDGSLNACLTCDEEKSGPVFKRTAGRTRRNSGIRSEIDRPEDEIYPIVHDYY